MPTLEDLQAAEIKSLKLTLELLKNSIITQQNKSAEPENSSELLELVPSFDINNLICPTLNDDGTVSMDDAYLNSIDPLDQLTSWTQATNNGSNSYTWNGVDPTFTTLIISEGETLVISNSFELTDGKYLINYGTVSLNATFTNRGTFVNQGLINGSNGTFENYGKFFGRNKLQNALIPNTRSYRSNYLKTFSNKSEGAVYTIQPDAAVGLNYNETLSRYNYNYGTWKTNTYIDDPTALSLTELNFILLIISCYFSDNDKIVYTVTGPRKQKMTNNFIIKSNEILFVKSGELIISTDTIITNEGTIIIDNNATLQNNAYIDNVNNGNIIGSLEGNPVNLNRDIINLNDTVYTGLNHNGHKVYTTNSQYDRRDEEDWLTPITIKEDEVWVINHEGGNPDDFGNEHRLDGTPQRSSSDDALGPGVIVQGTLEINGITLASDVKYGYYTSSGSWTGEIFQFEENGNYINNAMLTTPE